MYNYQHAKQQQQQHHAVYGSQFAIVTGRPVMFIDDHGIGLHQAPVYHSLPYMVAGQANVVAHPASMTIDSNSYMTMTPITPFNHVNSAGIVPVSGPVPAAEFVYAQPIHEWHTHPSRRHHESDSRELKPHGHQSSYINQPSYRSRRVNPSRRSGRQEVNMARTCTSCRKLWQHCHCANIRNRPDPKPYEKFVPPRLLNKGTTQKPRSES